MRSLPYNALPSGLPQACVGAPSGPNVTSSAGGMIGKMIPDSRFMTLFDDFIGGGSVSSTDDILGWNLKLGTGCTAPTSDAEGGRIVITMDGTDDDEVLVQTGHEWFLFDTDKRLYLEAKWQQSRTDSSVFIGLQAFDGGLGDANATVLNADHIGISLPETASISCSFSDGTTDTATDTTSDITAATDVVVAMYYDGAGAANGKWYFFVDGVQKGTSSVTTGPDQLLAFQMACRVGSANAATVSVDYVYCTAEL